VLVWLNGRFLPARDARVSALDRGLLHGDGVYDTWRTYGGVPFATAAHTRRLAAATRQPDKYLTYGASPRASIHMIECARALAFLRGRDYALPQDVVDMVPDVVRHRLVLSYEALSDALTPDQLILRIMKHLPAPERPLETHVRVGANA